MTATHSKQMQEVVTDGRKNQGSFFKPVIQTKLTINEPGDEYEQEADAVANKVMRMTDTESSPFFSPVLNIQRKCQHCEEEEKLHRKEINKEATAGTEVENYVAGLGQSGKSLSNETRIFFEPRMGYDFSAVKVHIDSAAAKSAQSVNAMAYTSGTDIVFNNGEYSPQTDSGKRLLGHELTHVVQQNSKINKKIQRLSVASFSKTSGTCGQRSVRWAFNLANPAASAGYIVQKIEVFEIISNGCPAISGPPAPKMTYWEAFPVRAGASEYFRQTGRGYSDTSGFAARPASNGTEMSHGTLKFFLQSTTGDIGDFGVAPATPTGGWGPGAVPRSLSLPSTYTEPSWWSGAATEGPATRYASSQWDCCSTPGFSNIDSNP